MNNDNYKPSPHSDEAEKTILGAILLENSLINQAIELLKDSDFYNQSNRKIYKSIVYLKENGKTIDPILIGE